MTGITGRRLAAAAVLACMTLVACSNVPQDMTVYGTVELTSVNGQSPAQSWGQDVAPESLGDGMTWQYLEVDITADDGPGNYSGEPWNEVTTSMTCGKPGKKMIRCTFTAQVPDDAQMYQIETVCCSAADTPPEGDSFLLSQMQAGPVVCLGDTCPADEGGG